MISRILHIAFMVLSSGAMSSPAAELAVIANGRMKAATAVNGKWEPGEKCIVSTGTHYLFADRGIGAGDFKVRARLSLDALNGSAAAFVLDNNKFGFEGSHRRMFVQGPKFADGLTIAEPEDFITPDQPFDLLVSRIGKSLTFHIDGKKVWETEFDVNEIKSVGLRPWRATMRIYEFSVEGNLIAASLPELTIVQILIICSI